MKYIIVLADGMADLPIAELGGMTPLEYAKTPCMDALVCGGTIGMVKTVPGSMKPGSDVANLAVMGYNPLECYSGRSPLEALSVGVSMKDTDVVFRCNIVTVSEEEPYEQKTILDHSSGEISTEDADILMDAVRDAFQNAEFKFYTGTSYRHITVWDQGQVLEMEPPHDHLGQVIGPFLPEHPAFREMMEQSFQVLNDHPLNVKRGAEGKNKANSLQDREHTDSFGETVDRVRYLVTDAISRQMVSDVPMGTFLSGGLDSSLISAVCARELAKDGGILTTFSVDYENNDRYFVPGKFQPNSDNSYIALMQQTIQSNHHWTVLKPDDLLWELENATVARDLPGMADVDFSLLAFCRQIRREVKMALSGECADEIFGGYPWYRDPEVREYNGFPWAQNTAQRACFLHSDIAAEIDPESFVGDRYATALADCDILPNTPPQERRMKQMVNLNQKWFMQTLLDRKDRMSMACGLEVRVPFCDYRIAEYLYGVPWEYKDFGNKEKGLLRHAMEGILPEQVLWRKKSPYPKTYDPCYLEGVSSLMKQILVKEDAPIYGLVDKNALSGLLETEYPWPWYGQLMKQPQTIAYMLQINFWLEHYGITIV